jgi:hypothetical protein
VLARLVCLGSCSTTLHLIPGGISPINSLAA